MSKQVSGSKKTSINSLTVILPNYAKISKLIEHKMRENVDSVKEVSAELFCIMWRKKSAMLLLHKVK